MQKRVKSLQGNRSDKHADMMQSFCRVRQGTEEPGKEGMLMLCQHWSEKTSRNLDLEGRKGGVDRLTGRKGEMASRQEWGTCLRQRGAQRYEGRS